MTFIEYITALALLAAVLAPSLYVSLKVFFWFIDRDDQKYHRAMLKQAENQLRVGELVN